MQPLPNTPYEPAVWCTARIQHDYTVSDGLNRYSVPFDLIGEQVDIRTTRNTVEVFYHGGRVASHVRRGKAQRDAIMLPEYMPEAHRKYLSYNKDAFLEWATATGPSTEKVVRSFLESGKEPEQGYKYCVSLMKAAERYKQPRIEAACEQALTFSSAPSLRSILTILKNGQDKLPMVHNSSARKQSPERRSASHGIIRGADAFRKGGANA